MELCEVHDRTIQLIEDNRLFLAKLDNDRAITNERLNNILTLVGDKFHTYDDHIKSSEVIRDMVKKHESYIETDAKLKAEIAGYIKTAIFRLFLLIVLAVLPVAWQIYEHVRNAAK